MKELTDEQLLLQLKDRFDEKNKALQEADLLTKQLQGVNNLLKESESLKSHFISNITNEIINPFTSIIGLSRNILASGEQSWEKVRNMVSLIHTEAFNLDFQLKNIFTAAKIEAGESVPEISNSNVSEIVKSVAEEFKQEADKSGVNITVNSKLQEGDCFFKTDPAKLKLVLLNLLSNAVKYSYEEGNVEITVEKKENLLVLSVRDYGTGISKENQQIIFNRFKRIDSGINSLNRGHGLGLSIIKAIMDLLNGDVEIESKEGKGALFMLSIPESDEQDVDTFADDGNEFFFDDDEGETF